MHHPALFAILGTLINSAPLMAQTIGPRPQTTIREDTTDDLEDLYGADPEGDGTSPEDPLDLVDHPEDKIRGTMRRGVSFSIGAARPWQKASLEVFELLQGRHAIGAFFGLGDWSRDGILVQKAYDLDVNLRSFGATYTYWHEEIAHLTSQMALGYLGIDGKVSPRGQMESETPESNVLSSSLTGHGAFLSASLGLSWVWESRITLGWTIIGVQYTHILGLEGAPENAEALRAARKALTGVPLFGFTGLGIGYLF